MALTFPRPMPLVGPSAQYFEPEQVDAQSPTVDGRTDGVTLGPARWHARWTLSDRLLQAQSDEWRAFVDSLSGQQRAFLGQDYKRPFPLSCPRGFAGLTRAGGGAFDGSATSWSINADRDVATLHGLPPGLILTWGDKVMWRWTTGGVARRSLCRVVEGAVVDGGGNVEISLRPPLPPLTSGAAIADLARPNCVMKLDASQTKMGEATQNRHVGGVIVAIQDLRA